MPTNEEKPKMKSSTAKEEKHHMEIPEALDGGYGWVIVVAAFFIHVVVDGASFGYGVMSKHIKEHYQVSESQATLVGSLQLGCYLLACPFAGKMVERLGFRVTCLTGSFLATTGFTLAPLSPNIYVMMITYGVIAGTGFGMMYLASISAVTLYFDKRRVLATGLATTGSGIGMFVFSAICNNLVEQYNWQYALLIVGGIAMQGFVFGMLLLPLERFSGKGKKNDKSQKYSPKKADEEVTASLLELQQKPNTDERRWPEVVADEGKNATPSTPRGDESGFASDNSSADKEPIEVGDHDETSKAGPSRAPPREQSDAVVKVLSSAASNLDKKDLVVQSLNYLGRSLQKIDRTNEKEMEMEDLKFKEGSQKLSKKEKARNCLDSVVEISLLKDPVFYIICVANIFCFLGTSIPLKFQVDRALTFDIASTPKRSQEMADFLVSVSGIANTVGRAASALLDVNRNVNKLIVYNLAVLSAAVACFFNFFSTTYTLMCVFASVFTFFIGVYIALSSVVVCEMMGPEAVNNAFALMCMLRGFANIAGGPIAGAAYDKLQNYDVCFYIGGAMLAAGGVTFCLLLLPQIQKRSYKNLVIQQDDAENQYAMITSVVNVFAAKDPGTPRVARAHPTLYVSSRQDLSSLA